jgi:AcrR family transcriptional regulator
MTLRENRRAAALDRIADAMLAHGLAPASLKTLAQAANTSDRMLLYYFANKDDIVASALQTIAARMAAILAATLPNADPARPETVLDHVAAIARGAELRPYMRLWLEVTILSARGEEPYRAIAGRIADGFIAWVASRLDTQDETQRHAIAARIVAIIDGLVVLDLVGREATAALALSGKPAAPF